MSDKVRILVVEDEMPIAMMMVHILHIKGCEVETASSGEKALSLAQSGNFDLITLDINLPGMNGFEICRRLKLLPQYRATPVVFVSGRMEPEYRQRAFQLGAADYILKPFNVDDFLTRICSLVELTAVA